MSIRIELEPEAESNLVSQDLKLCIEGKQSKL